MWSSIIIEYFIDQLSSERVSKRLGFGSSEIIAEKTAKGYHGYSTGLAVPSRSLAGG